MTPPVGAVFVFGLALIGAGICEAGNVIPDFAKGTLVTGSTILFGSVEASTVGAFRFAPACEGTATWGVLATGAEATGAGVFAECTTAGAAATAVTVVAGAAVPTAVEGAIGGL